MAVDPTYRINLKTFFRSDLIFFRFDFLYPVLINPIYDWFRVPK